MATCEQEAASLELIAAPAIEKRIFVIRERQVMLDEDLADLYSVETKRLIEQVKRNLERFPEDFMFQLHKDEVAALRSQIATSNTGYAALQERLESLERRDDWAPRRGREGCDEYAAIRELRARAKLDRCSQSASGATS